MAVEGTKDRQTVDASGQPTRQTIEGVVLRRLVTQEDRRGEIVEMYNPAWGVHEAPLVYAYQAMIRPGRAKGWVRHARQDDRIFTNLGVCRWVLYDDREGSPTRGRIMDFTVSDRMRVLFTIPAGVWHAVQNVGTTDAYFANFPTRPYEHADPDKFRLPLKNDVIPFDLDGPQGW